MSKKPATLPGQPRKLAPRVLAERCGIPSTMLAEWSLIQHVAPPPASTPESIQDRIRGFVESCRSRMPRTKLAAAVTAELNYLRRRYKPTSVASMVTDYRRALATSRTNHPALAFFALSEEETDALRQRARAKVVANQRAPHEVTDPVRMIQVATRLLVHPSSVASGKRQGEVRWQDLAVGLALLTGRRPIELMASGKFASVPGNQYQARFCGQAKTRDAAGTRTGWFTIPLLAPYSVVATGLRALRAALPASQSAADIPHDALHNSFSTSLNRAVATEFPGYRPYDMRAVYALLCHTLYAPDDVQQIVYYADILGHKLLSKDPHDPKAVNHADTQTACYYLRFYLSEANRRALKDQGFRGHRRKIGQSRKAR